MMDKMTRGRQQRQWPRGRALLAACAPLAWRWSALLLLSATTGFFVAAAAYAPAPPSSLVSRRPLVHAARPVPAGRSAALRVSQRPPSASDVSAVPPATSASPDAPGSTGTVPSRRTVDRVEKFARLPVWPAWNGVLLFVLSKIFGDEVAARLEDKIGGRVCPNFFVPERTSPFVMLVHHRHSFAPWDPLRYFQRTFFPEGFPAHPHRGFITVTYILRGGFEHRDSMGVQQFYGAERRHGGKHTQWLTTGAGLLHEEMWDIQPDEHAGWVPDFLQPSSQELYQLWLNVPARDKLVPPKVELLGGDDQTPTVATTGNSSSGGGGGTRTVILAGEHGGRRGSVETCSSLAVLHVQMDPASVWEHELPEEHRTGIVYVRRGSIVIGGRRIPPHHTAYLGEVGRDLIVEAGGGADGADFLLLAGEPLNEPIMARGSMVMNTPGEIDEAYRDYQSLQMGAPWDHKLSDEGWLEHVRKYPSRYKPAETDGP